MGIKLNSWSEYCDWCGQHKTNCRCASTRRDLPMKELPNSKTCMFVSTSLPQVKSGDIVIPLYSEERYYVDHINLDGNPVVRVVSLDNYETKLIILTDAQYTKLDRTPTWTNRTAMQNRRR